MSKGTDLGSEELADVPTGQVESNQSDKPKSSKRKGSLDSTNDSQLLQVEINTQGIKSNKDDIVWRHYGGKKRFSICNKTDSIHAVKIRCSDNSLFRITPAMASVQPNETLTVRIYRTRSPIKPDKIVIFVTPVRRLFLGRLERIELGHASLHILHPELYVFQQTARIERHLKELFRSPYLPISKISINQQIEAKIGDILAYYKPCAPPGTPCLKFDHVKVLFNGAVGGSQNLRITNTLALRIGIKIQCTDNFLYTFKPIFTTMEKKETIRIKITRSPHPRKKDKMVVCTTILKDQTLEDLPDLFDTKGLKITEIVIPLTCT
ncbi:hypothetical protein RB195_014243 [Necator americanus]|uniref:Major sperm protein n=1 Tax=Necator americanus TaxID=51031 RepID=A0ABR1DZ83_NECAM